MAAEEVKAAVGVLRGCGNGFGCGGDAAWGRVFARRRGIDDPGGSVGHGRSTPAPSMAFYGGLTGDLQRASQARMGRN